MVWALRAIAAAGTLVALWDYSVFAFGYPDYRLLFALWAVAPFPAVYGLSRWLAPGTVATRVAACGMLAMLGLATWTYADAVKSFNDQTESLSGLIVIFGPLWQYAVFAPFLLVARLVQRRAAPKAPATP